MAKGWPKGLRRTHHDCDSTAPLQASSGHYQWHTTFGEPPCKRSLAEYSLATRQNRERRNPGHYLVYVVRVSNGMWYYGATRAGRRWEWHATTGPVARLMKEGHTAEVEVLCRTDSKEKALELETRMIVASDRSRLLNEKLSTHLCDHYEPNTAGYFWHRRKETTPCENALQGRRDARRKS